MLQNKSNFGYSLIEVLISLAVLSITVIIGFGFLFSSLSGSNKAEVTKLVRQNGNYALSVMEGMIRTAKSVEGCENNQLDFVAQDGYSTFFYLNNNKIASGSSTTYLTSNSVSVNNFLISCTTSPGKPASVDISFTIQESGPAGLRASEKSQMNFSTRVIVRNDVN